mmetsp:Transcript_25850/g.47517  ORF Transcript_25850/g.47517 Transcript_25850/m.47517 type:complete len:100 (+) Transcript_25850:452-751(+)
MAMTKLEELDLGSNFFTGPIPSEIYALVNLCALHFHDNILMGTFSPSFSHMTNLTNSNLDANYISKELPTKIGLFGRLAELNLCDKRSLASCPVSSFLG